MLAGGFSPGDAFAVVDAASAGPVVRACAPAAHRQPAHGGEPDRHAERGAQHGSDQASLPVRVDHGTGGQYRVEIVRVTVPPTRTANRS